MILDRLENASAYRGIHQRIDKALEYLGKTDFSRVANGKYELDGDRLFAMVQRYRTRTLDQIVWEAHRRYIDVQYIVAGAERMGYLALREGLTVKKPYDEQGDAILFEADGAMFTFWAGSFAVFMPQDVHAPGLAVDNIPSEVVKVVVKCRIE
jgi:YhcH/YjgK/YiaL family protein